jgi:hypothetical protein
MVKRYTLQPPLTRALPAWPYTLLDSSFYVIGKTQIAGAVSSHVSSHATSRAQSAGCLCSRSGNCSLLIVSLACITSHGGLCKGHFTHHFEAHSLYGNISH